MRCQMDMASLKADPRFKEKYKIAEEPGVEDKKGPSEGPVAAFYRRIMARIRPNDGDW